MLLVGLLVPLVEPSDEDRSILATLQKVLSNEFNNAGDFFQ
jgi:hypothetical protein